MSDLIAWLLEQITEDERIAMVVLDEGGLVDPQSYGWQADSAGFGDPDYGALIMCEKFAARWRPRAVLAECEAKRAIIERHQRAEQHYGNPKNTFYDVAALAPVVETYRGVLRFLALPYADRPGYREEWRP